MIDYMDKHGFIGHQDPVRPSGLEFGDCTQRTFTRWVLRYLETGKINPDDANQIAKQLQLLVRETKDHDGNIKIQWVRHWDDTHWPGQLWIMSRDNFEMLFWTCIIYAEADPLIRLHRDLMFARLKERRGFLWNYKHIWPRPDDEPKLPDGMWPWNQWAKIIRSKKQWWLWPVLCILDRDLLINSVIRVWTAWRDPHDTSADLLHTMRLAIKQKIMWTPTVWLAKIIYRLRPRSAIRGQEKLPGKGVLTAWRAYYSPKGAPPMDRLAQPIIESYIYK